MKSNDWRVWSEREAKWCSVWGCDRNAVIWVIEIAAVQVLARSSSLAADMAVMAETRGRLVFSFSEAAEIDFGFKVLVLKCCCYCCCRGPVISESLISFYLSILVSIDHHLWPHRDPRE
jgi:hypothetical protein